MPPISNLRIQNCIIVSNVDINSLFSDPSGKIAAEIKPYLLEHTADSIDESAIRISKANYYLDSIIVHAPALIKEKNNLILQLHIDGPKVSYLP